MLRGRPVQVLRGRLQCVAADMLMWQESLPGLVHSSNKDDPFQDSNDQNGASGLSGASGMDGEDFEEAFSPPDVDDLQALHGMFMICSQHVFGCAPYNTTIQRYQCYLLHRPA